MTPEEQAARESEIRDRWQRQHAIREAMRAKGVEPTSSWYDEDIPWLLAALRTARQDEREAMKPLLETCSAVIIDVGQDALEDPVGYNRRADDGFCRVSIGPVDRLRDQLAAIRARAKESEQ